jgi:hypothetical protein
VKTLKPLQFSLEEIQDLLGLVDAAANHELAEAQHDRLSRYVSVAEQRCGHLREQLDAAEQVARELRRSLPGRAVATPR